SKERAKKYSFTRTSLIGNWGLVYARPNSNISSLLALEGKRVAVMKNNIHDTAFRKLVEKFDLKVEIVALDNFRDVMKSVQTKEVDAGVANRLFGVVNADKYDLVETGIVFNPINIHYASQGKNHISLLNAIDQQLSDYKTDKDSVYFSAIRHWMNIDKREPFPLWLIWLAIGLFSVIILMLGLTMLLRRQVASRTKELQSEVNEKRLVQRRLNSLAYYDSLTKLPNRVSFLESLNKIISHAQRNNTKIAVLFIDIDRFKTVNDSLGHDAGDRLIIEIAKRLQACLRNEDIISRFGGDEFIALLDDINNLDNIQHVTQRMLNSLNAPINIDEAEIYSSVCIGIALYPDDDAKGKNILKYADAAMYHAKEQGGNNYQFYNEKLTQRVQNRLSLETRMQHALERDEFKLYYQPIFNLKTQQIMGVEALIRWQDPEQGIITPDEFIPIAEETGLIVPIGEWVIEEACKQVHEWRSLGYQKLLLAVNISSRQFDNNKLYTTVTSAIKNSGINSQQLELEITERMFLNISKNVRETLNKLTAEGVNLSIDDFGTGYSSLSYLKKLPINTLKIDRSFITGIPTDKDDIQIASTIVTMAHGLNLDVVAEGIETKEQLDYLKILKCQRGQGYYLSRPQPANKISNLLMK
ncbi:diguanylate cyclase/phosphodiesterase (GGDEF & EAL domains) with PAS/PAC sensor(s), partial [hydrothermal vent metagenome]